MGSAIHEKLSVREPAPRGAVIEAKVAAQLASASDRASDAVATKAGSARAHNERVEMVVNFMKVGERMALAEKRQNAEVNANAAASRRAAVVAATKDKGAQRIVA